MYERFFGISKNPFSLTPDPRFLMMTSAHSNVKAGLTYALMSGKGFTVLTGDAGTGKTTLLRSVINAMPAGKLCFSLIANPVLTPDEFWEVAVTDFGLPKGANKPERLRSLQNYLLEANASGRISVLFVDEAQRLSPDTLEEIRLLTNFETETKKLLQIVLVGQDELGTMLDLRELRQLKQRVEVRLEIGPLMAGEVWMYIRHRWRCVSDSEAPFSPDAVRLIRQFSGGIPRLINSICDNALLLAFAESSPVVTEQHIREVNRDLRLVPVAARTDRRFERTEAPAAEKPPAEQAAPATSLGLRIPPPVEHRTNAPPVALFANGAPRRSWWWPRLSKAQKA